MSKWIRSGLLWGILLYALSMVLIPLLESGMPSTSRMLMGIPLWIVVGLSLGYLVKDGKKKKRRR